MWSRTLDAISMAKLPRVIQAPGVDLALTCEQSQETWATYLKVCEIQGLDTLDTMGSVELTEGATTPKVKLVVQGDCSREETCTDLSHADKGQLFEKAGHILTSRGRASAELSSWIGTHSIDLTWTCEHNSVI